MAQHILKYRRYISFLFAYSIIVILWGAFVRISGSGNGCGENWPLCHGQVIPLTSHLPTWIEFSHRLTSGLYGFFVLGLVFYSFKMFPKGHMIRKMSLLTLFLTIVEALLGARLVLAGLVADNASIARAYTMAMHLINSLLLVGSIAAHLDLANLKKPKINLPPLHYRLFGVAAVIAFLIIGASGAIASLSTTLFPSESLLSGLVKDLTANSHFLVKIRISHPMGAFLLGGFLIGMGYFFGTNTKDEVLKRRSHFLILFTILGLTLGLVTLLSLSPLALKLIHLSWAYVIWSTLTLCLTRQFLKETPT